MMSTSANQRYGLPRAFENDRDGIIFDYEDNDDNGLLTDQGMVEEQLEIMDKSGTLCNRVVIVGWFQQLVSVCLKFNSTENKFELLCGP